MSNVPEEHYTTVIDALTNGSLVTFLGAGANLCNRPDGKWEWSPKQRDYLPSGRELSEYLAEKSKYPFDDPGNLSRVSQYTSLKKGGSGELYTKLREVFDGDYPSTQLHDFLAALPADLKKKGYPKVIYPFHGWHLLVTTNYDDLLERAFRARGQPYHVVWYMADGKTQGKCYYRSPEGKVTLIENPDEEKSFLGSHERLPIILKIHGAIDRETGMRDSFVITEDHYIQYLTHTSISNLLPHPLAAILEDSHILFLGYRLQDWNLRVILHRIWSEQRLSWDSWAIQHPVNELDRLFWEKRGVKIFDIDLKDYVAALRERVARLDELETDS